MNKLITILIALLFPHIIGAEIAPKGMTEFNKTCPAQQLCPDLERYYQSCNKKPNTDICIKFINILKKLSPIYDCQRPFDKTENTNYIVPAIWLCGESRRDDGASYDESYYGLLSRLKLKEAKEYFASPLFRSVLDGHMAEEYYDRSERLEKILKKRKKK